ncbi:alpha/beta fold hydrolase [Rhodococcoides kyotonense]|nr:alpha/beta fold hydrolase [Rhodococcus kyotonensis]
MSGLVSSVPDPRAVVVAWHGGASRPDYFDAPGHSRHSLMQVGASLGFSVIAPHRPGYGSSREMLGERIDPDRQVALSYGVVDSALQGLDRGAGCFLVGHSQGCVLALRMAVDPRGSDLLGIEMAGTGIRHNRRSDAVRRLGTSDVEQAAGLLRELLWQPAGLYPQQEPVSSRAPAYDGEDALAWPAEFARSAPNVSVPVRISLGDHESWWQSGEPGLVGMSSLFTASVRTEVDEQIGSGHNVSLGNAALAYHLKVLAFVEECVLSRQSAGRNEKLLEDSHG